MAISPTLACSLIERVMSWKNEGLVWRLQQKLELAEADARLLFDDTKRFLYLCAITAGRLAPPNNIDECWHHFILFTKEYAIFCDEVLGQFIHHQPNTPFNQSKMDGEPIQNTKRAALDAFGECLSLNWAFSNAKCSGSTNCQDSECTSCSKCSDEILRSH